MADFNVFWVNKNEDEGITGTGIGAQVMGLVHPSVNCLVDQFIAPVENNPRGFVFKGGSYIKMLLPKLGGHDHLVFGVDADLVVNYAEQRLDTGISFQAGKDYYIYLCYKAPTAEHKTAQASLVVSLNSTYPQGYDQDTSRKIGGFHTLCVGVGTIAGHPLSGFNSGDILPASFWCLTHRPTCQPEGMAHIKELDVWVDIYLQSGSGVNTKSFFGGTITDTQTLATHFEDLFKVGKTPLSDPEFSCAAEGSNQQTVVSGAKDPVTTGGHVDTAGRRMISNYGLEDCCGALWQNLVTGGANGGSAWSGSDGGKGACYGGNTLLAGGSWDLGTYCGSRCRGANHSRLNVYAYIGCRGRARSRAAR